MRRRRLNGGTFLGSSQGSAKAIQPWGDVLLLLEQVAALPLCSTSMLPILCNNIHLIAALHILCILHLETLCRFNVFHMLCSASSLHLM